MGGRRLQEPLGVFIGSAENLVGRVLHEQGLGKYCDADFVRATQRELAEAFNLTQEEMDRAAHEILQAERRRSLPYLHSSSSDGLHLDTGNTNADPPQQQDTTTPATTTTPPPQRTENGKTGGLKDTSL